MSNLKPGLYIVATPIGNLGDITLRALETLKNSDFIYAENTRNSSKLLEKYEISTNLKQYNDNSDINIRSQIVESILSGQIVTLISDAGTPLISDPGYKLVRELINQNIHVDTIPGACALISGLVLSGLPTDKFYFHGFLPKSKVSKEKTFQNIIDTNVTHIFYESPNRLVPTLKTALLILGDREACVARELTKLFQEASTKKISELIAYYNNTTIKGEIILILSGKIIIKNLKISDLEEIINAKFQKKLSAKTISDEIYLEYSKLFSKKEIYKYVNSIKNSL